MNSKKKIIIILVIVAAIALTVLKLFVNKKQIAEDLKEMQEFSNIIPVEVVQPQNLQAMQQIQENGTLRSESEVSVLSEISGKVLSVSGNVGDHVSAGQTLVTVEREVLDSQFKLAKTNLDNAEKDMARYTNLLAGGAVSQQQFDGAKLNYQNALANYTALKNQIQNTVIKSPVAGVISKRMVEKGNYITPGNQTFSVISQSALLFVVKLAESDISSISKGQKVQVSFDVFPDKIFTGTVHSIGVQNDMSGRYEVEINVPSQGVTLRSGMSGKAAFENNMKGNGLIIPRKCLVGSVQDATVYVLSGDSVLLKTVKASTVNESEVLITEGLTGNEKVVLSGQINLQEGSKVKVIKRAN